MTKTKFTAANIKHPINLTNKNYNQNKNIHHKWLRENAPVYKGKMMFMNAYFLSRYEDCLSLLKDARFIRNRSTATGKSSPFPFPMPKSLRLLSKSMITEDGTEHRRLRNLVHKAFTPRRLKALNGRIESLTHELLDKTKGQKQIDLKTTYALPIPVIVISEMVGISADEVPQFTEYLKTLTNGFSSWKIIFTMFWKMPKTVKYVRNLINKKRSNPQDDILTGLIEAQEEGSKLSEDELVSLVFLLIIAGHETTVHLITNSVITLLTYPQQLALLKSDMTLVDSTIEEVFRYNPPVQTTKPNYASEDVTLHGVTIPKGSMVFPLLGSANMDPDKFENPETFDIARTPNKHLGLGQGIHYCLGAPLARMETKSALQTLFERYPNVELAIPADKLELEKMPGWHRYKSLPVNLN
ncbi:cytochrome P450 [Candidatus Uabimicrobium sp. HlEnr_7]|uniref:cytochrome P450 family protein n=1 Tax=Candidatus Uabimicrobium helgolandensis TaxID=3095367 RepID=UPI003557F35F